MLDRSICESIIIKLLQHFKTSDISWKTDTISPLIDHLFLQYKKTQKFQELNEEYSRLYDLIQNTDDKEQRYQALADFEEFIECEIEWDVAEFCYLAGFNDAYGMECQIKEQVTEKKE
jgi:hypothetical protein